MYIYLGIAEALEKELTKIKDKQLIIFSSIPITAFF